MDYFSFKCKGYYYGKRCFFSKDSFTAKADRPLGFISSNISVSAENLIETQKINYTQPLQLILEEYRIKPWTPV
jgi:hypothetical protein